MLYSSLLFRYLPSYRRPIVNAAIHVNNVSFIGNKLRNAGTATMIISIRMQWYCFSAINLDASVSLLASDFEFFGTGLGHASPFPTITGMIVKMACSVYNDKGITEFSSTIPFLIICHI